MFLLDELDTDLGDLAMSDRDLCRAREPGGGVLCDCEREVEPPLLWYGGRGDAADQKNLNP